MLSGPAGDEQQLLAASPSRQESELPIFQMFPIMRRRIPWIPLGNWPTPITVARRFADAHHLGDLHVKREDLSHPDCGGNKIRGLEFLLAEARRRRVTTLLSFGAAGSHHLCRTAWHARRLGLDTVALIVKQPTAEYVRRNVLTGLASGTRFVPANTLTLLPRLAWEWLKLTRSSGGGSLMVFPPGGTSPLACLGHVNAALELKRQIDAGLLPEPDYLYAAMGSLGTVAGLALGCKLAGLKTRVVGVVVSYRWFCTPGRWARLARRTLRLMRQCDAAVPDVRICKSELSVVGTALGRGYAQFTDSSIRLAQEFFDCQQIQLDGTYTAKTLDGMMQFIHKNGIEARSHLFWNSFHNMPSPDDVETASLSPSLQGYLKTST